MRYIDCKIVVCKCIFTIKIQLWRRAVKLRIVRHIIVLPSEKIQDNM